MGCRNRESWYGMRCSREILAAPAADEGILVVNTGAGSLFGFNTRTGEQLWRHEGDTSLSLTLRGISGSIAFNGGAIGTPTGKIQVNLIETGVLAGNGNCNAFSNRVRAYC